MKRTLEKLCEELSRKFHNINSGGCCVVAGELSKYIPNSKIIVATYSSPSIDAVRNNVLNPLDKSEWTRNGMRFNHVAVQFIDKGVEYIVDSDDVYTVKAFTARWHPPAEGFLTTEEAVALGESTTWNTMFCRSQIPGIFDTIREHLA